MSITFKTHKQTSHITNSALLSYGHNDWFPIRQDGRVINNNEFIRMKMEQFSLRTPGLVIRALRAAGHDNV